jgi:gliding motility-associated-like protein
MKNRITLISVYLFTVFAIHAQYTVRGGKGSPLLAMTEQASGLEVYLLNGIEGAEISYTSKNDGEHQWFKYRESASEAVPVSCIQSGKTSTVTGLEDGYGYFVGHPETIWYYVWIIDYSLYKPKFFSLTSEDDGLRCKYLNLLADAEAEPLSYYLPSGVSKSLQRTYVLTYNILEWIDNTKEFIQNSTSETLTDISVISLPKPPLTNTVFTLKGDAFAIHFGEEESISLNYNAVAVEAHATAETDRTFADNELHDSGSNLGGSAPVEYLFTAYANEPIAALYIWKIWKIEANRSKTSEVIYKNKSMKHKFEKEGNFIVNLEVSDFQSLCVDTSQVFNVTIGETYIKIPNAFSPGSSIGVNDEFRISYRSIVSFRASIFNRWGNLLYRWTDPSQGWDGRVHGKYVPTGVYYVIVEYTDSSGKKHTESSDINILRSDK